MLYTANHYKLFSNSVLHTL